MDTRALIRFIFNLRVLAISLLVALLCSGGVLFAVSLTRTAKIPSPPATGVVQVIPQPTDTPVPSQTPTPEPTPTAGDVPAPPSDIAIGALVQVSGTGGDGLRLRADPGLEGTIRFLGLEAEVFQVEDGPRELDGYAWWLLVALYDPEIRGWGVANYLRVVQNP